MALFRSCLFHRFGRLQWQQQHIFLFSLVRFCFFWETILMCDAYLQLSLWLWRVYDLFWVFLWSSWQILLSDDFSLLALQETIYCYGVVYFKHEFYWPINMSWPIAFGASMCSEVAAPPVKQCVDIYITRWTIIHIPRAVLLNENLCHWLQPQSFHPVDVAHRQHGSINILLVYLIVKM